MPLDELATKIRALSAKAIATRSYDVAMEMSAAIIDHATERQEVMAREILFLECFLVQLMREHGHTSLTLTDAERDQKHRQMHGHFKFDEATQTGTITTCSAPTVGDMLDKMRAASKAGDLDKMFGIVREFMGMNVKGGVN